MYTAINNILLDWGIPGTVSAITASLLILLIIAVIALAADLLTKKILLRVVGHTAKKTRNTWDDQLERHKFFVRLSHVIPVFIIIKLFPLWLPTGTTLLSVLQTTALISLILVVLFSLNAFFKAVAAIYQSYAFSRNIPINGLVQVIKLIYTMIAGIFIVSLIIGKSPTLLVSGLGALTAVLMLIFKDPILGFVAGIQLSANRMLSIGDWLDMPKYGADGDVIDISLTTVKVQNWDKTITTIPTYALISDSFKNWRGMSDSGGRRIMRNLYIDLTSVHFLSPEETEKLRSAQLIRGYLDRKRADISAYNREKGIDESSAVNGRRLTNIGTFRAYLLAYLREHPQIHNDMTLIVRQLEPSPQGVPMQIYAFVKDTRWANYESIQSDIFDHILAVIPEFGLLLYQQPSGSDLKKLIATSG